MTKKIIHAIHNGNKPSAAHIKVHVLVQKGHKVFWEFSPIYVKIKTLATDIKFPIFIFDNPWCLKISMFSTNWCWLQTIQHYCRLKRLDSLQWLSDPEKLIAGEKITRLILKVSITIHSKACKNSANQNGSAAEIPRWVKNGNLNCVLTHCDNDSVN